MKLPTEGARWFVQLRWVACALLFGSVTLGWCFSVVPDPRPHYIVGLGMMAYNFVFWLRQRSWSPAQSSVDRHIAMQMLCDILALTLLLYFADLSRNPFLFFYVHPMIIVGMYLRGRRPYYLGLLVTALVGGLMAAEYLEWIPRFPLQFPPSDVSPLAGLHLLTVFVAFAATLWIALYFATSIRSYVDRAHDEIRQQEKIIGIGQLVAGIGHQVANPLDGVVNCLNRIGDHVKGDPRLTEYVKMMEEALDRIEKTTKRVQAFARPHGIDLQDTAVNNAVEATLQLIGTRHGTGIEIETDLADVASVRGDPYTLQEVLFNLFMNAIAAMPQGGRLLVRTLTLPAEDDTNPGDVAIDVSDTGVGIPTGQLEKVFEPFYTTRAESGGTGLGLGLCRMMISEMNGRIRVESRLNEGTTFTVILPRAGKRSKETQGGWTGSSTRGGKR